MNALTVDVEDYYQTNGLNVPIDSWDSYESRVVTNTRRLLERFEKHKVRASFFIVGCVARQYPELVKDIAAQGHEIGSHSGWHRVLSEMDADRFREDVRTSKHLLENISGQAVYQYRAPSWSLDVRRYEWLSILEDEGYRIDSSIQPFRTLLSGSNKAPIKPFRPVINGQRHTIIEFPSTVWNWGGLRVPFSGGLYLRAMPLAVVTRLLQSVNRSRPGMVYIHPWEMDPDQPRIPASPLIRFAQYHGLEDTERKLERLLELFHFQPLGDLVEALLQTADIPDVRLE